MAPDEVKKIALEIFQRYNRWATVRETADGRLVAVMGKWGLRREVHVDSQGRVSLFIALWVWDPRRRIFECPVGAQWYWSPRRTWGKRTWGGGLPPEEERWVTEIMRALEGLQKEVEIGQEEEV